MIWVLLLLYAIFIYYFILKSDSQTNTKIFSALSGVFLILMLTPLWSDSLFMSFINISLFFPFVFGFLGIILGWFGIKGGVRGVLLFSNILAMVFYLIVFLIGTVGFQQP
ncbi:hypothetical protein M3197_06515 [Sporosarcina aquimarina]|uniref:hypothetical protein n=1 Tax=Sporosarcina aquimarina TaxID=114975 RepID=UPI0020426158|nr:hypothetical protein [Sporosarcina aquimarina]MCM3757140.1 hypothetical protein [Sporosarcina aquimarina]